MSQPRPGTLCARCKREEVEVIDDWVSTQCGHCNDRDIERSQERREWAYYHPSIEEDKS